MTPTTRWTGPAGAWIEIDENGAVGLDFGWPPDAPRFAYLGTFPPGELSWEDMVVTWCDAGGADGEGVEGEWARTYLTAEALKRFLEISFGVEDPRCLALSRRVDSRHRYLVSVGLADD